MGTKLSYKPGSFYRICQRTGFAERAERTQKEWNNLIVRTKSWEPRQPQDLVRGVRDIQTVPEPRPRSPNVFVGVQTTLTADATGPDFNSDFSPDFGPSYYFVVVASVAGFTVGNFVSILLDNQDVWTTMLIGIDASALYLFLQNPLPSKASAGNFVYDAAFGQVSAATFPGFH